MRGIYFATEADISDMSLNSSAGRRTDLGVAYYEDAYHWVVEDRTERYREELRTFLSETHTTEGGE